jgi:hypothetical protein
MNSEGAEGQFMDAADEDVKETGGKGTDDVAVCGASDGFQDSLEMSAEDRLMRPGSGQKVAQTGDEWRALVGEALENGRLPGSEDIGGVSRGAIIEGGCEEF